MRIGILHPGEMGVTIGASLAASGHEVLWASDGRSAETRQRAAAFTPCGDMQALLAAADGVIVVCPPHAAVEVAARAAAAGFDRPYVDANAISPGTARRIAELIGTGYVDGGIIGPPAQRPGTTRLYLSGPTASRTAAWFTAGALQVVPIGVETTAASALKMAYAAYTKGSSALLLAVNALASSAGVAAALREEWALSQPGLLERSERAAGATSRKAWRFEGEMREIAQTFDELALPDGFHRAAAEIYRRMADLKDLPPAELDRVVAAITARQTG